jgi:hypothetical protein
MAEFMSAEEQAQFLAALNSASSEVTAPPEGVEHLYSPGERHFGVHAVPMFNNGWMVVPQERDERRMPSKIDGRALKWGPFQKERPPVDEVVRWTKQAPIANTAIILGPVSGNTFSLDVDVSDERMSVQVQEIAAEILGETPFRRVGSEPKIALVYRYPEGMAPANRSHHFVDAQGEPSHHAIEILGPGKQITAFGLHHKTGKYFGWLGQQPTMAGPELAPEVTPEQLAEFLDVVEARIGKFASNSYGGGNGSWEAVDVDGVSVPRVVSSQFADWTEDSSGIVVDGRDAFLWALVKETVKSNPSKSQTEDGKDQLRSLAFEQFRQKARHDGKWTDSYLKTEIWGKVSRAAEMLAAGIIKPRADVTKSGRVIEKTVVKIEQQDDTFSYLPQNNRSGLKVQYSETATPENIEKARLKTDRSEIGAETSAAVVKGVNTWLDDVYGQNNRVHILKAPTGSGKTTKAIATLAADPRTKAWDNVETNPEEGEKPGPFVFLLPTYSNIAEVRERAELLNLDGSLSDDDLRIQASERGLVPEDAADSVIAGLRISAQNAGLRTMVYKGKIAAGCQKADKVSALMKAGIGTAGMCKISRPAEVEEGEEPRSEEITCEFYASCPAIQQRKDIPDSHIVFMPKSFLSLSIPKELKNPRGVIADESIFDLLVHYATFDLEILTKQRADARLTKDEKAAGMDPLELHDDRKGAVAVVLQAIKDKVCPAAALRAYEEKTPKRVVTGLDLVRSAKRVTGSAIVSGSAISPDMSEERFNEVVTLPQGEGIKKEHRFWSILEDRIKALIADELARDAANGPIIPTATGDHDYRLQVLANEDGTKSMCISWLEEANWTGVPTMLLDASADEKILGKVFSGREIVVHEVPSDMNLRTMAVVDRRLSVKSFLPGIDADAEVKIKAARIVYETRQRIARICAMHANGRVVFHMPLKVRRVISKGWAPPVNADFLHIGAEAGLNFAERHVAVVEIGRQELPTWVVDAIVAALTYRDPQPEERIDYLGTGMDDEGKDLMPAIVDRDVLMRDGKIATYAMHEHLGPMARRVQSQAREEKARQGIGRVRAVYSEETKVAYVFSQSVPDDLVIDDVRGWDDFKGGTALWDAVRLAGGIIDAELMLHYMPEASKPEAVQRWIGKLPERVTRNYHRVVSTDANGSEVVSLVPGVLEWPGRYLSKMARAVKVVRKPVSLDACQHQVLPADVRPECKVEAVVGSREDRVLEEDGFRQHCWQELMRRGEFPGWDKLADPMSGGLAFRCGQDDYAEARLSLGEWQALSIIDDPWVYSGEEEEAAAEATAVAA